MPAEAMKRIFSEENTLQKWLDVEAALAKAEAAVGLIPNKAAEEIAKKAHLDIIDRGEMDRTREKTGHRIVALIHGLEAVCEGESGQYIHYGATSQDVIDTGTILQIKEAYQVIYQNLREIESFLLQLAEKHADTVMAGRTHGQHALPLTFGYKVAVWLREVRRHIERMKQSKKRVLIGQMGGAVGTMASFGDKGPEIQVLTMKELGIGAPDICWQAARDNLAEFVCLLAMISETLAKIANEVYSLQKSEFMEVEEPFWEGKIGSSTMPHKRNPRMCEELLATSKSVRYAAALAIEAIIGDHERDSSSIWASRNAVSHACIDFWEVLVRAKDVVEGLIVYPKRMEANLDALKGLIVSEVLMLELGQKIGRLKAHDVVYDASMEAFEENRPLKDVLKQNPIVTEHLSESKIDSLLDAKKYIGLSPQIAREMVALTRIARRSDE